MDERRQPLGRPVRLLGLTGGIATGKTTAARFFAEAGATVVDADVLARELVEPGKPAWEEIRKTFGEGFFLPDGRLDRERLGALIFRDAQARLALNRILHPRVEREAAERIEQAFRRDPRGLVVYDVPLLFEAGLEARFDAVAVVYVPRQEQIRRLARRDGAGDEAAQARVESQMDIEEKAARADFVLDNRGGLEELRAQVERVLAAIRSNNREFWG